MQFRRREFLAGLAGSAALAATFPKYSFAQSSDEWAKVNADAKKEGMLQIYSVVAAASFIETAKAFEKKTGIRTEFLATAKPNELREKVRSEQAAGRFTADIMLTTVAQTTVISVQDKTIAPLPAVPGAARLRKDLATSQPILPMAMTLSGMMVNTELVKPGQEPKKWTDLLDPRWKGQILLDDPRSIGGGYLMFYALYEKYGREFLDKLAAQQPMLHNEPREAIRRVARQEKAILLPVTLADTLEVKGLPIKAIVPEDGVMYNLQGATVLQNAPHPNAARLFVDFVLSDEAQKIFASAGFGSAIGDAAKIAPPEVQEFVNAKLMGTIDPAKQNEMMGNARAVFK